MTRSTSFALTVGLLILLLLSVFAQVWFLPSAVESAVAVFPEVEPLKVPAMVWGICALACWQAIAAIGLRLVIRARDHRLDSSADKWLRAMVGCLLAFIVLVVAAFIALNVLGYTTPGVMLGLIAGGLSVLLSASGALVGVDPHRACAAAKYKRFAGSFEAAVLAGDGPRAGELWRFPVPPVVEGIEFCVDMDDIAVELILGDDDRAPIRGHFTDISPEAEEQREQQKQPYERGCGNGGNGCRPPCRHSQPAGVHAANQRRKQEEDPGTADQAAGHIRQANDGAPVDPPEEDEPVTVGSQRMCREVEGHPRVDGGSKNEQGCTQDLPASHVALSPKTGPPRAHANPEHSKGWG